MIFCCCLFNVKKGRNFNNCNIVHYLLNKQSEQKQIEQRQLCYCIFFIRWMKIDSSSSSSKALISDYRRIISSDWLFLRHSNPDDSGKYKCQVADNKGQIEADIILNVHGSYQVTILPNQQVRNHFLCLL